MGIDLYIHRKDKKGNIESIEVPRSTKIYKWIISLGKQDSCYIEGKIGKEELEKMIAAWIAGRFMYTPQEPSFKYDVACYVGWNHPEIVNKIHKGEIREIPKEIVEEYLEYQRKFQGNEVNKVVEFVREGLEKGCEITFSAA